MDQITPNYRVLTRKSKVNLITSAIYFDVDTCALGNDYGHLEFWQKFFEPLLYLKSIFDSPTSSKVTY